MSAAARGSLGKVAVVGTGAIGGFYGGFLARSGQEVHFHFRSDYDAVQEKGLRVTIAADSPDDFQVCPLIAHRDTKEIGICDWVILATKSTANSKLVPVLNPLIDERTSLLTLQNGMGNVEFLEDAFPQLRRVVAGLCFTCSNRVAPGRVENYFPGYVQFGEPDGPLSTEGQSMMDAFATAGISCKAADLLDEALWRKLCWNVPFNGLTVVAGGITTDVILQDKSLSRRARALMEEIQLAAGAYKVEIEDEFLDQQFTNTIPMGAYKPSSLIDFLDGRELEVKAIWGEPLRRGQTKGVPMPELDELYQQLLETQSS